MKDLDKYTEIDLIKAIFACDKGIARFSNVDFEHYLGAVKEISDIYYNKSILIDELLKRRQTPKMEPL